MTPKSKRQRYKELDDSDKQKLKQTLYILDKFWASDAAYHELAAGTRDISRKYLIYQYWNDVNDLFHIQRTSGNIQVPPNWSENVFKAK